MMATVPHILSLAIPIRNAGDSEALKATLDSVAEICAAHPVEVLIQVGQGTRETFGRELLEHSCTPGWSFLPDTGIYPAMNILCKRASGSRILFLGAGDRILAGLPMAIARWSDSNVENRLELGGVRLPGAEPRVPEHYPARWDRSLLWRNTTHHQGIAYPRSTLLKFGGFPEEHHILGDYAMNLRLWSAGVTADWVCGEDWVSVAAGGVSRRFTRALYAEERALKRRELKPGPTRWVQPLWIGLKSVWKRAGQEG